MNLKQYIKTNFLSDNGKLKYSTFTLEALQNIHQEFYEKMMIKTQYLKSENIKELLYHVYNNLSKNVTCSYSECNNITNFISFSKGYHNTCSASCSAKKSANKAHKTKLKNNSYKKMVQKQEDTMLKKYGKRNGFQLKYCREKLKCVKEIRIENIKKSCLEKYGVENVFQAEEIKEKIKQTCLERYGYENISQSGLFENTGYKWKEYEMPSGEIIKYQGYENYLFDELLLEYNENSIITARKDMPEFWYFDNKGKKHRYFPDVYIPETNTIYEVKSEYTLNVSREINELKFKSVIDAGFNFILKIY